MKQERAAISPEISEALRKAVDWGSRTAMPADLREDARQEAWIGVLDAVSRFHPEMAALRTFAVRRARGAVLDFLRREDPLSRLHRRQIKRGEAFDVEHVNLPFDLAIPDMSDRVIQGIDLERLIAKLPARDRWVVAQYLAGCPDSAVAKTAGKSRHWPGMVRTAAIQRMRDQIRRPNP
jgi:RNA polymerase sigma factor (sigma-70 family)